MFALVLSVSNFECGRLLGASGSREGSRSVRRASVHLVHVHKRRVAVADDGGVDDSMLRQLRDEGERGGLLASSRSAGRVEESGGLAHQCSLRPQSTVESLRRSSSDAGGRCRCVMDFCCCNSPLSSMLPESGRASVAHSLTRHCGQSPWMRNQGSDNTSKKQEAEEKRQGQTTKHIGRNVPALWLARLTDTRRMVAMKARKSAQNFLRRKSAQTHQTALRLFV